MTQDQYSGTLTQHVTRTRPGLARDRWRFARTLHHIVPGLALALVLACIEAVVWLLNPGHLFDSAPSHTLAALFALVFSNPLVLLAFLAQVALSFWLALFVTRPLALLAYCQEIFREQERYRVLNTPLQSWSAPYDVPLTSYQDDPDPTRQRRARSLTIPELIEAVMHGASSHWLLLGASGAGKTLFLHAYLAAASQHRRELIFGRRCKLPILLPLKHYALFLQALDLDDPADFSLLDFLLTCDLPGLTHLRPHLGTLFQQGRLLLLCDGLDDVPAVYRPALDQELTLLLRQSRNTLLLTCTPRVYEQSPELIQAVGENLVPRAIYAPLDPVHMRNIVERYNTELSATTHPKLPTAGQMMAMIGRTRLFFLCATPFYLFALLEVIAYQESANPLHLDTRGRLLSAFLNVLEDRAPADGESMLDFLGELACIARWRGDDSALYLAAPSDGAALPTRVTRRAGQDEIFLAWAQEQRVTFPFAAQLGPGLTLRPGSTRQASLLELAQLTSLLDRRSQDVASFRHPLLASALLADYFARMLGTSALDSEVIETFPDDLAPWSEPLTLWAGLLEQPLSAANALALYASEHPEQRVSALVLGLICLGVAQTPPLVMPLSSLPPALVTALEGLLEEPGALLELAVLLMRCAERGSPELYQALFPLLALNKSEDLLALLDPALVADLFFQRLLRVIDDMEQEALVKRLVRALSCWGEAVVPRATLLCGPDSGDRLRTAAINLLGGTHAESAVKPLITCLRDPAEVVVTRAAHALIRLGPDIALPRLLRELELRPTAGAPRLLHGIILPIIARYLDEPDPTRQLTPVQNEQVIDALMSLLATHTNAVDLDQVRAILISQGRLAEERESGKMALSMLVQNLTAANESVARSMSGTLKAVGQVATPRLLEQLASQPAEAERVRILEVLASLHDPRALPSLLDLLADDSLAVQQALAAALKVYVPACIPGLIDVVLRQSNELVATRAEQILGELGSVVVEPVIHALTPLVAGRTPLLVHVLERVRDPLAVPALIELLESTGTDVVLTLALAQALGQLGDERAAAPLLDLLNSTNALLAEGALNALSSLGELACPTLLARLATPQKTPLVKRIERVLLGMQPFPGARLLQTVDEGSGDQARHLADVFVQRGSDAAQVLVENLFHEHRRIREYARQVIARVDGRYAVPALLEALGKPDPAWRELLTGYLLKHPREAIPALVGMLDDPERYEAAVSVLLQAGAPILPALIPALDASDNGVQSCARHILVTLVQQQPDLLTNVVQLFGLSLPPSARKLVQRILTDDLAESSLPALLVGLEDAHLARDASETLVLLAQRGSASNVAVLEELLAALRVKTRRYGAALTLIDLGSLAVPGVGALITDPDPEVAQTARSVLSKLGTPALPFLWAAHSDTSSLARRDAAREVLRAMPGAVIKDELVSLLTSARQEELAMALALLLERLHDEALQMERSGEMLPALLEHVQTSSNERANLRILALLILLGGPVMIGAVIDALYADPQGHTHLLSTLLLLGQGVENELQTVLRDSDAPEHVQAEVAGILAMLAPRHQEVQRRALSLSEHGLWAGRSSNSITSLLQPSQLEGSLRALGGLLVAGHWDSSTLQTLRATSKVGSAERELYDVLLGWRYSPQLTRLEHELSTEREERKHEVVAHAQEALMMKAQMLDLENDLDTLKQEHHQQRLLHEEQSKESQEENKRLNREKQDLQASLRQTTQEKQALAANAKQALQEKERLQAEAKRWQEYSQQLEREVTLLRRPK